MNKIEEPQELKENGQYSIQTRWYDRWWGIALMVMLSMVPAVFFEHGIGSVLLVFAMLFFLGVVPVFLLIFVIAKLIEKFVFADKRHFLNRNLFATTFLVIGMISALIGINTLIHPNPTAEIANLAAFIVLISIGVYSLLTFLLLLIIPLAWNVILKITQRKL